MLSITVFTVFLVPLHCKARQHHRWQQFHHEEKKKSEKNNFHKQFTSNNSSKELVSDLSETTFSFVILLLSSMLQHTDGIKH